MMDKKPMANLREAANAIVRAELEMQGIPESDEITIWLNAKTGALGISSNPVYVVKELDSVILLWKTKAGLRSLSDLMKAIESNPAEPFHGHNFFQWYLKFHFSDRIEWR